MLSKGNANYMPYVWSFPIVTVGTQAAVLAGLDVTMFIEFQPPPNSEWVSSRLRLHRCLIVHCFVFSFVILHHHSMKYLLIRFVSKWLNNNATQQSSPDR